MPEGDTVWLTAHKLHGALAGGLLTRTDFRLPELATTDLSGRTVIEVVARGKHILLRTSDELTLHSHLMMDGSWTASRNGKRLFGQSHPAHHLRVVLETAEVTAQGHRVHDVRIVPTARESDLVGHLGPDLLGPDWDVAVTTSRLLSTPDRMIGPALLDQRNLAGLGNLYKCELLFLRGVSPWAPVSSVADLPAMMVLAHRLLRANRDTWAQVTTGVNRPGQQTWVYERGSKPCRRCGTPIRRADQHEPGHGRLGDPRARSTYWCPHCQPGPGP
ncbi:Fpg/Nei family DNA glycosylase [Fodinicola acaciae]|uniref:Fpg/Nei family DNA glycosylase n=1 Tax=Fodinicola acaciae TaxID=2681555 RepID=UPI0013D46C3C|nr:Fpg/Nei family DNA glycosylase [Fodinicola acaciae]